MWLDKFIDIFFKILNNMILFTSLNVIILNSNPSKKKLLNSN